MAITPPVPFHWIWKAKLITRIKFNTWLLFVDRLNMRNVLHRKKHLEEGYNYVMCQEGVEEMTMHLFFECTSSVTRWFMLGVQWGLQGSIF